jgi:hypothetical protein
MSRQMKKYHKIISLLLLSGSLVSFSATNSYAGFHLGLASAIKAKAQELKDKKEVKAKEAIANSSWITQLGTSNYDRASGVTVDQAGNIYITGYTEGGIGGHSNIGGRDIFLTKYSSAGTILWTRQFGTSSDEWNAEITTDDSGNTILFYNQESTFFLAKYNTNGARLWGKQFENSEYCSGIATDQSGNIYVTGCIFLSGATYSIFLTKYDENGNNIWRIFVGNGGWITGVTFDSLGNLYINGWTQEINTGFGRNDVLLMKYNSEGVKLWTNTLGTTGENISTGAATDLSGNIYITGWSDNNIDGNQNNRSGIFLAKYDTNGAKLWVKLIGTSSLDGSHGVATDPSGNAYVTGYTEGYFSGYTNQGKYDLFLVKYDTNGTNVWEKQIGTSGSDEGYAVVIDQSERIYIAGVTEGNLGDNINKGSGDALLIKITP